MRCYLSSLVLGMLVALSGCSSKGDNKVEEPAEGAATEDGAAEPAEGDEAPAADAGTDAAAPDAADAAEAAAPAAAPAAAAPSAFNGPKVTRYVTSYALNVRNAPSKDGAVVRHVKWGDKVEVVISGEWAKLAEGQYIAISRLSESAPVAKGAHKGKGKRHRAAHKAAKASKAPAAAAPAAPAAAPAAPAAPKK